MPRPHPLYRIGPRTPAELTDRFVAIRRELGIPEAFPAEVERQAGGAAHTGPVPAPDADLTDLPFVTLDPPGATDLDQAMHLTRRPGGYHVDYAIADVPSFVPPDGAVAAEAGRRGQTVYCPDGRTPLHPTVLSEGAASLLPGVVRPAFVWRFDLDAEGEVTGLDLVRALVRNRRQLDYASLQADLDAGRDSRPGEPARLLAEIGELRRAREADRGGAGLPLPDQEVDRDGDGYVLRLRPGRPVEDWNAQLSLMTGMAAAGLMLSAGVGVLRTMPAPPPFAVQRFRRQARRAGVPWPESEAYGAFLRRLDSTRPEQLALLHAAGALFRGASYTAFDGAAPEHTGHAAVAAPYAHVTAPLRRLVDRFGLVAAHAAHRGEPVPHWVRVGLPGLPAAMAAADRLAGEVERRCVDAVEAALLASRVGEGFAAVVVEADSDGEGGRVQLLDPPVLARCAGPLTPGARVRVVVREADPRAGTVRLDLEPAERPAAEVPDGR